MPNYTETVSIYSTTHTTDQNGNVLLNSATLIKKGVSCNIHRGSRTALDSAAVLGIFDNLPSEAYLPPTEAANLKDRYILVDASNQGWLIRGTPSVRTRFPATAHCKCLLTQLNYKPDGLP